MENTIENKRKFFAQYWGQNVGRISRLSSETQKLKVTSQIHFAGQIPNISMIDYLELKSLKDISDEDAIEVARLFKINPIEIQKDENKLLFDFYWGEVVESVEIDLAFHRLSVDCLRSKGYALPWMGLSVEEQLKRNWIKLK